MTSGTIFHHDLSELPVNQKEKLCQLLDQNDSWVELGRMMQFSESEIAVNILGKFDDERFFFISFVLL